MTDNPSFICTRFNESSKFSMAKFWFELDIDSVIQSIEEDFRDIYRLETEREVDCMFQKLPSNSKKLLDEILTSDNPAKMLSTRFKSCTSREDSELRGILRELKEHGHISIQWADNVPFHVLINNSARTYDEQLAEYERTHFPVSTIQKGCENDMQNTKPKKIFVSHASKDAAYVQKLIELFEDIGLNEDNMVCSSVPGYGIPLGEDIYDWLGQQFREFDLHVLFILSENYYDSVACQNEMGAAWVLQSKHDAILLPGFEYESIKGAVNPRKISIKLDGDEAFLKQHLNELKDSLVREFGLTMPSASKWERHRTAFLDSISALSAEVGTDEDNASDFESENESHIILTEDAAELLLYAAKDPSGRVLATKMLHGIAITTNGRPFCSPGTGPREEARWKGALEELELYCFLKSVSSKREVFVVTREGYAAADELEKKSNIRISPARDALESLL